MNRRSFIGGILAASAAVGAGLWWRLRAIKDPTNPPAKGAAADAVIRAPDGRPVFGARHKATLTALMARLVPDDEMSVGAIGAGAFGYIERALAAPDMQGTRQVLLRGASVLDRLARGRGGTLFDRLKPDEQDDIIGSMLAGEGAVRRFKPERFIQLSMALCLEGMFSDPLRGGNTDGAGWGSIGYMMHPPRPGQCHPSAEHGEECE